MLFSTEFRIERGPMNRPFFLGGGLPTGKTGGMKSHTFAGKDEWDVQNQLLKWRANNPHAVIRKIHPIKRADLVGNPSSRFLRATARCLVTRMIDYQD